MVDKDGRINYINESQFADMLEGKTDQDSVANELETILNSVNEWEGELV